MPTVLRFRRGDTTASNAFTGAEGELFVDTSKDTVVVHDGVTAGGKPLATEAALTTGLASKVNSSSLATVATSGSYNDLTNKPSIPSLTGYATETYVNNGLSGKQTTLVSGTNIKTVNGTSILGSGNITISGGAGGDLTQVSSDITPLFDGVYDIGSSTNRFYDAYLGNKLDIGTVTLAGSMTGSEGSTTSTTETISDTVTGLDVSGSSMGFYMTISNSSTQPQYPDGTVLIYTSGYASVPKLEAITPGTVLSLYDENDNFVRNVTTTSFAIPRWDNSGMMFSTDATSPTYLGMMGGTKISYSNTVTTTTVIPDTREWTLATNASLVAPEVVADVALLGTNLIEADTITPEHILGAYSDQKGTLIVDGSLKVNDDLQVRNAITLQQEPVTIGKVVSFSSVTGMSETVVSASDNWQSYFKDANTMAGSGGYNFYVYPNTHAWSQTDLSSSPSASTWAIGNTYEVRYGDSWWKFTITNVLFNGMQTSVEVVDAGTNASQALYVFAGFGMSSLGQNGMSSIPVSIAFETVGTVNSVELDKLAIELVQGDQLLINGNKATVPVTTQYNASGSISSLGLSTSGDNANPSNRYFEINGSWLTTTNPNVLKVKDIFTSGNNVQVVYSGQTGVYSISNTNVTSGMSGPNTKYNFTMTFVSGVDHMQSGNMYYAMGGMGQTVDWSTTAQVSTNYTTYLNRFVDTNIAAYTSASSFDWLNVGDELSYIPSSTSISFTKDDGTLTKAITYNNTTGDISYDGLVMAITKNSIGDIYSADAATITPSTNNAYQAIAIGKNAFASTAGGYSTSVAIGNGSTASGNGVNIGAGVAGNDSVSIIGQASNGAVSIKGNAQGSGAIAIGAGAEANSGGIALGYNAYSAGLTHVIFGHNYSAWSSELSIVNSQVYTNAGTKTYYSLNTYSTSIAGYSILDLISITNTYQNTVATLEVDTIIKSGSSATEWQLYRSKYVVYHSSAYVWQLTQTEAPVLVASGSGISGNGWTIGMELYNNTHLAPTVTSLTTRTTAIRSTIKVRNLTSQ